MYDFMKLAKANFAFWRNAAEGAFWGKGKCWYGHRLARTNYVQYTTILVGWCQEVFWKNNFFSDRANLPFRNNKKDGISEEARNILIIPQKTENCKYNWKQIMNFCDVHKKFLWSFDKIPIVSGEKLCYNVDTTEREEHSNVHVKYKAFNEGSNYK